MAELELRHLRAVRAVAGSGSVSKASTVLGVSQPALTAQLRRIEKILGGELFERGSRGTRPTALGDFVLSRADALLTDMRALVVSARQHVEVRTRSTLHLGYMPLLMIGSLIEEFRDRLSELEVRTWGEPAASMLLTLLRTGRVDVALIEEFDGMQAHHFEGLSVRKIITEPVFIGIGEHHPAIRDDAVDLADLAECDWIQPPPDQNPCRLRFLEVCARAGFTPRVPHYTSEAGTAGTLVAHGAVGLAQAASAPPVGMRVLPLRDSPLWSTLLLVTRADEPLAMPEEFHLCIARAYRASVDRNPHFRRWWRDNPQAQQELDAFTGPTRTVG